jgi:hypothetical protein
METMLINLLGSRKAVRRAGVCALVLLTCFGAPWVLRPWMQYRTMQGWTKTLCTIVDVRSWYTTSQETDYGKNRYQRRTVSTLHAQVLYAYQFGGRWYRSENVSLWHFHPDPRFVQRFPRDARAVCRVNPKNPSQAVLLHDFDLKLLTLPLLFMLLFLFCLSGFLRASYGACSRASVPSCAKCARCVLNRWRN